MDPRQVSAQFAAYVWFTSRQDGRVPDEGRAVRYARDNWVAFLPCADEGIGRLLIRVADRERRPAPRRRSPAAGRGRKGRLVAAQ
jgi:hypothetical protein